MEFPKNYDTKEAEARWQKYWEDEGVYKFDPDSDKEIYSVDTPPPTVSGKMHIGHAFSYTQQDIVVRFQRMLGKNIFFPFGTDDNGLATDRLIEKTKKVRSSKMDRQEYIKLCLETLDKELRPKYVEDWKRIGMSCDWSIFYSTINDHCRKISQRSFIELFKSGREYRKEAPTMWCPVCQTAIAQVECEDKEFDSYFNTIIFKVGGEDIFIATTRPELLPACVAVFYHPDDERYKKYEGKKAKIPLFDMEVLILPDKRADPEKGTGAVMCCTFGDQTDMEWYFAHELPLREAISRDGRMTHLAGKYEGLKLKEAREQIIEDLKNEKLLVEQEPIKHAVNVHERCGTEIEILNSKQWFIKYLDLKEDMLEWGNGLNWYPKHMKVRYDHWVKGLQWDWCISRQRHFGISFPVWYCKDCDEIIMAKEEDLPVDPLVDKPPVEKCLKCGCTEFKPEKDVFDTWATSSLTPQIAVELFKDKPIYKKLFPMNLRPQAHDIITFWLFNTVVKSQLHNQVNPWKDVVISGHAQDPHRKKMSKSKGNVVEPQAMIEKYSSDALRFWAAGSKLGDDLPWQEKDLVTAQKVITKLWNASKFVMMHLEDFEIKEPENIEMIDRWMLSKLNRLIMYCTKSFEKYEYSKAKLEVEKFFWHVFCDNYLEIIKDRIYNPDKRGEEGRKSAQFTLYTSLLTILKMMAPIMPHISEEIYSMYFAKKEGKKSIHNSQWPSYDESKINSDADSAGDFFVSLLEHARRAKADKQVSLKEPMKQIYGEAKVKEDIFNEMIEDLKSVTKAEVIKFKTLTEESKKDGVIEIEI